MMGVMASQRFGNASPTGTTSFDDRVTRTSRSTSKPRSTRLMVVVVGRMSRLHASKPRLLVPHLDIYVPGDTSWQVRQAFLETNIASQEGAREKQTALQK